VGLDLRRSGGIDGTRGKSQQPRLLAFSKKLTQIFLSLQINWNNRYVNSNGSTCLVTVDGTDCHIREPTDFNKKWYSHKFHGPGLRYEVAVCIRTGWIVWINGPYPCGEFSDRKIVQKDLELVLAIDEMYVADKGYRDGFFRAETPDKNKPPVYEEMKRKARSRHEATNNMLKAWRAVDFTFRSPRERHGKVFGAVANITQIMISKDGPVWPVEYDDRRYI